MGISYNTILNKMEEKIREAKMEDSDAKVREYVQAIKVLSEVILDEKSESVAPKNFSVSTQQMFVQSSPAISTPQTTSLSPNKLETDDGANGDSIFDF